MCTACRLRECREEPKRTGQSDNVRRAGKQAAGKIIKLSDGKVIFAMDQPITILDKWIYQKQSKPMCFKEEKDMGQIGSDSAVASYATDYQYRMGQTQKADTAEKTSQTGKKKKVGGRTVGEPVLSEKALKYYEKLKKKYSNMDFILVSPEKKEEAERNKGMYQSQKELLVLIDSDKIEKMAEDDACRQKYESILSGAGTQMNQMKSSLGSSAESVRSFGMTFDDHGNASFFAVVDKSLVTQRERIAEKKAEKAEEKKKAAKKEEAEKRAEKRAEKTESAQERGKTSGRDADQVTVTASSWEDLIKKIDYVLFAKRADSVITDAEKMVGNAIDYSL